jgi:hypothetical protein
MRCEHCGKDKSEVDPGNRGDREPWKGFGYTK